MSLPELDSTIVPDNQVVTTQVSDGATIETTETGGNSVESYVSLGSVVNTTHNTVPIVETVETIDNRHITTTVNGFWDVVWSVNGQTGDVELLAVVNDFEPNTVYSKGSLCTYDKKLYRAKTGFISGSTFVESDWDAVAETGGSFVATYGTTTHAEIEEALENNNSLSVKLLFLPEGFQAVEYIASSGTQYINTGFIGNENVRIEITAQYTSAGGNCIIGSCSSAYNPQYGIWCSTAGYIAGNYGNHGDTGYVSGYSLSTKQSVAVSKNGLEYSGTTIATFTDSAKTDIGTNTYPLFIFGVNDSGSITRQIGANLYTCKLYNDSILYRDFIPCYTTATCTSYDGTSVAAGSIGLYDKVSGKFFRNMGGGTFTKGDDSYIATRLSLSNVLEDGTYVFSGVSKDGKYFACSLDSDDVWTTEEAGEKIAFDENYVHTDNNYTTAEKKQACRFR